MDNGANRCDYEIFDQQVDMTNSLVGSKFIGAFWEYLVARPADQLLFCFAWPDLSLKSYGNKKEVLPQPNNTWMW
jgi:hypothetical protein